MRWRLSMTCRLSLVVSISPQKAEVAFFFFWKVLLVCVCTSEQGALKLRSLLQTLHFVWLERSLSLQTLHFVWLESGKLKTFLSSCIKRPKSFSGVVQFSGCNTAEVRAIPALASSCLLLLKPTISVSLSSKSTASELIVSSARGTYHVVSSSHWHRIASSLLRDSGLTTITETSTWLRGDQ